MPSKDTFENLLRFYRRESNQISSCDPKILDWKFLIEYSSRVERIWAVIYETAQGYNTHGPFRQRSHRQQVGEAIITRILLKFIHSKMLSFTLVLGSCRYPRRTYSASLRDFEAISECCKFQRRSGEIFTFSPRLRILSLWVSETGPCELWKHSCLKLALDVRHLNATALTNHWICQDQFGVHEVHSQSHVKDNRLPDHRRTAYIHQRGCPEYRPRRVAIERSLGE